MCNITLLSSFHKQLGKCNPNELYKIIEDIQPEVIFEELSIDFFNYVYTDGYSPATVELIAMKKYLRNYSVKHFPVDTYPKSESELFDGVDEITQRSDEYVELWNEQVSRIKQNGYDFLNSNACIELLDKTRKLEETVLSEINNVKLSREFRLENELHNKREYEMLRNIYYYSSQYPYNKALFICGVEHRKPIKHKILEYETKENLKLNWTFYENQNADLY